MPVKRGPDGTPVSVPTSYEDKEPQSSARRGSLFGDEAEAKTLPPDAGAPAAPNDKGAMPTDQPTKLVGRGKGGKSAKQGAVADPKTRIAGGAKSRPNKSATSTATAPTTNQNPSDAMADPVVGWLVVADGPGKGNFLKLGYGQNSIGRGPGQRVTLDFGDSEISRDNHAILTYDPRGRVFYIQQGSGTNLTYMDGEPVLSPTKLPAMSRIALGSTTLLFVPLCGDSFNWDE